MTTVQAAELLRTKFLGGAASDDAQFVLQDFIFAINAARGYKLNKDATDAYKINGSWEADSTTFETFTSVPVLHNETTDMYYSELPQEPLGLPYGRGIQMITPQQDPTSPFFFMMAGENWMFSNLPATYTSYWYDTNNIYYKNIDPKFKAVSITMIPMFSDSIHDDLVFEVIDLALTQFLKAKGIPNDMNNNSNPNITTNGN